MNIDLSEKELSLLEDALFPFILKKHAEALNASEDKKAELSAYLEELENLNHKIWKAREGISL